MSLGKHIIEHYKIGLEGLVEPNEDWETDSITELKSLGTASTLDDVINVLGTLIDTLISQGLLVAVTGETPDKALLVSDNVYLMAEDNVYLIWE